ncbi:MAG: hypothetical protein KatS3mg096_582 [Candidatus Parcubacteria bacterium]|nr:MAG: hypothetical protein KatS3mg096_582 [Candidatus Parcubacteria bacterium]
MIGKMFSNALKGGNLDVTEFVASMSQKDAMKFMLFALTKECVSYAKKNFKIEPQDLRIKYEYFQDEDRISIHLINTKTNEQHKVKLSKMLGKLFLFVNQIKTMLNDILINWKENNKNNENIKDINSTYLLLFISKDIPFEFGGKTYYLLDGAIICDDKVMGLTSECVQFYTQDEVEEMKNKGEDLSNIKVKKLDLDNNLENKIIGNIK